MDWINYKTDEAYIFQLDQLGFDTSNKVWNVTKSMWEHSYPIWIFKLTQAEGNQLSEEEEGEIRLRLTYGVSLPRSVKLFFAFEHEKKMSINASRNTTIT